jgi:hypothetical protein
MNQARIKKLRKQYRKSMNGLTNRDLRKTIFRLARNRDILGIILILENIAFAILIFIYITSRI